MMLKIKDIDLSKYNVKGDKVLIKITQKVKCNKVYSWWRSFLHLLIIQEHLKQMLYFFDRFDFYSHQLNIDIVLYISMFWKSDRTDRFDLLNCKLAMPLIRFNWKTKELIELVKISQEPIESVKIERFNRFLLIFFFKNKYFSFIQNS